MRGILIAYAPLIIWTITILEAVISYLSFRNGKKTEAKMNAALACGLAVDAFIQAIGTLVGAGAFLHAISQIRYILHGILVPLLIPMPFYLLGWMKKKSIRDVVLGFTLVVIVLGILMGFMTRTRPEEMAGILRYAQDPSTPAFASSINRILSIGGVIPLIVLGLVHLFKDRKPWAFLAGFFMFAFSALAPATGNMDLNFLITLFGELLMVAFLYFDVK